MRWLNYFKYWTNTDTLVKRTFKAFSTDEPHNIISPINRKLWKLKAIKCASHFLHDVEKQSKKVKRFIKNVQQLSSREHVPARIIKCFN